MKKYLPVLLTSLSFLLPLGLYTYHLSPTYIPIDSAEFTMCMYTWGLCHPPGFPLYVMLGHFFFELFPIGEVIWRANFFSALFGAGTLLFVFLILKKLEVRDELVFLGTLMLAVTTSFWEFSLSADVFTFGTFLVALSLFLAVSGKRLLSVFILGLSASHFYLTAVIFPLYVWYFFKSSRISEASKDITIRNIFLMCVVFALGFFPQIILYFRMQANPEINWGHHSGIGGFIDYVRRKEFGSGFLLSNPALVYSPLKNAQQIWTFFKSWFVEFGLILPIFALASFLIGREKRKEIILIWGAFGVYAFVQLFLLSTIEPGGVNNPFQLNKFYLVPFLLGIILATVGVERFVARFAKEFAGVFTIFLGSLVFIYLLVNWQTVSFRSNYFSENLVLDALEQLPSGAVAITVDHVAYFGGLYEQKVNKLHTDKTLLYFPNEKNKDNEYYHPNLFQREADTEFIRRIESEYNMGAAERYILSVIAKNPDRDIYILQGEFEYNFFKYLGAVSEPYGLWTRVVRKDRAVKSEELVNLLFSVRNKNFKREDFFLKQQGFEATVYAISYYQSAIKLASLGYYDEALTFFDKSYEIDSKTNIKNDRDLVLKVRDLSSNKQNAISHGDIKKLRELADGLFTLKNYVEAVEVYEFIIEGESNDALIYNNAASAYLNLGNKAKAKEYFEKALSIDPQINSAKKALEKL